MSDDTTSEEWVDAQLAEIRNYEQQRARVRRYKELTDAQAIRLSNHLVRAFGLEAHVPDKPNPAPFSVWTCWVCDLSIGMWLRRNTKRGRAMLAEEMHRATMLLHLRDCHPAAYARMQVAAWECNTRRTTWDDYATAEEIESGKERTRRAYQVLMKWLRRWCLKHERRAKESPK